MTERDLLTKVSDLPVPLRNEVNDFVDFLIEKHLKHTADKEQNLSFGMYKGKINISDDFDEPLRC